MTSRRGQLRVEWSEWRGHYTTTKGNRLRYVPLTKRLVQALRDHRHLGSRFVLTREGAAPHTAGSLKAVFFRAAREAGVRCNGTHIMRHTFCSHLAMRGAAPVAIQELAGHKDLTTTLRYMHLSPSATRGAIELLEQPAPVGEIVETEDRAISK